MKVKVADTILTNGRFLTMEEGCPQAVDRIRALEAYTKNSAYLICREDSLGTLKAGKLADIVVFEDDYLNVPEEELKNVRVHMTMSGGEVVYQRS